MSERERKAEREKERERKRETETPLLIYYANANKALKSCWGWSQDLETQSRPPTRMAESQWLEP